MTADMHMFMVEISEFSPSLSVICPYRPDDTTRPCWPHHEDGEGNFTEPDSPPQEECTYQQWVENEDPFDMLHGSVTLWLYPARVEWSGGNMEIHLGDGGR